RQGVRKIQYLDAVQWFHTLRQYPLASVHQRLDHGVLEVPLDLRNLGLDHHQRDHLLLRVDPRLRAEGSVPSEAPVRQPQPRYTPPRAAATASCTTATRNPNPIPRAGRPSFPLNISPTWFDAINSTVFGPRMRFPFRTPPFASICANCR